MRTPIQDREPYALFAADMTSLFPGAVGVVLLTVAALFGLLLGLLNPFVGIGVGIVLALGAVLAAASVKVANQWERGVVLRLGKFQTTRGPGLFFIVPIIDQVRLIDTRLLTHDVRRQEVITRDNVPVSIDGVLFFRVVDVEGAVLKIQDYAFGVMQLAQTALRDVVGGVTLDELLAERERIGKMVREVVERQAHEWGLEVVGIRLQDVGMPEDLKKIMSRQAAAEREKRATITKAEGDRLAAENLAAAAATMHASPGAMQLRTLQSIDGLGPQASNTVVLALPIEVLELARSVSAAMARPLAVPRSEEPATREHELSTGIGI